MNGGAEGWAAHKVQKYSCQDLDSSAYILEVRCTCACFVEYSGRSVSWVR